MVLDIVALECPLIREAEDNKKLCKVDNRRHLLHVEETEGQAETEFS